jgi:hypothetical protein
MSRKLVVGLIVALAVSAASLLAANPNWNRGPSVVVSVSAGTISITGKATGLGNVPEVDFVLTGDIVVDSRCYTKKGNTPQAANKQAHIEIDAPFSAAVNNGQTTLSQVITFDVDLVDCPGGQEARIEDATYSLTLSASGFPQLTETFSSN